MVTLTVDFVSYTGIKCDLHINFVIEHLVNRFELCDFRAHTQMPIKLRKN